MDSKIVPYSIRGFNYALINLGVISLLVLAQLAEKTWAISCYPAFSLMYMVITGLSFVGLVDSIKGLKDPKSAQKFIGLLLNSTYVILFVCVLVANILDLYIFFSKLPS